MEPALTIVPWTNTRNILEAASISVWLLDERIKPDERISRSYAFRCEGLEEQVKFARADGDSITVKDAEKRRDKVLQQAKRFGIVKQGNNGQITLAEPMPSVTTLVRDQLNEEAAYRLFSAITHAHSWALIPLGFSPVRDMPHGKLLGKSLRIESVGYLASIALKALPKPIMCKCRLFGWPTGDIQTTFGQVWSNLKQYFLSSHSDSQWGHDTCILPR